jgi:RHS repeat-associated protein
LTDHVSNQKTYYADGAVEYTEFGGNGILVWTKSLIYFGGSVLSTITPNGQGGEYTEYHHPDRLGTRLVTNQPGGTSYEQVHLPFGNGLDAESTGATGRRFTSYERSARTGLDYAQNRTYDPKQGRFTQVDPIGFGASTLSDPQSLNLYAYCGNDPINYVDPSGLGFLSFLKKLFKWVIAVIAVVVAILTIIAAPATIAGVLGAISATAAAGSNVMSALGYSTAAKILGWIAIGTGIGAGIATMAASKVNTSLIIKNFVSTAEKTIPWWQKALTAISYAGAISNAFSNQMDDIEDALNDCRVVAFLSAIAWAEGADYQSVVKGKVTSAPDKSLVGKRNVRLTPWPKGHPNILVKVKKGLSSTAAGRYQITKATWKEFGGNPDHPFTPLNQDLAATRILKDSGALGALQNDDFDGAVDKASKRWASLPGSKAGQPMKGLKELRGIHDNAYEVCKMGAAQ